MRAGVLYLIGDFIHNFKVKTFLNATPTISKMPKNGQFEIL